MSLQGPEEGDARFFPPDRLVYAADGWLWTVGFDPGSLTTDGRPQRVRDNVAIDDYYGHAHFDIAAEGTLVYVPADVEDVGGWCGSTGRAGRPRSRMTYRRSWRPGFPGMGGNSS